MARIIYAGFEQLAMMVLTMLLTAPIEKKYASSPYMPHMLLTQPDGPVKATVEVLPQVIA
ncbi:hypothetical protein [Lacticaseibacillus thailandensis]|uniref:hypothetical protein n=1 Tax=Lacticaseibacillus thailandensis TaxID=381741 RepID=UPI0006D0D7C8|nr:hypothetical protein [Lacticaseibacillus thailandensis]